VTDIEPGFILIDKEQGWTSHDVVATVRNQVGGKVGHAGTLDPIATGLLILAVGGATRLLRFVQGASKEYVATAQFGVATDSLDADGAVLTRDPLPVTTEQVEAVLERFRGEIHQVPPMVSARKVEGRRLYELAREGQEVEREARPVTIYELELLDIAPSDYPEVTFRTVCSTGTYIRTLGDDIARALGGRAHLTELRRTRNGGLSVQDGVTVDNLVQVVRDGSVSDLVISPKDALAGTPEVMLDQSTAMRVRNGVKLDAADVGASDIDGYALMTDADQQLLAVYRRDQHQLLPEVVLA
jgi:tRNA pseudouridine55 synthase